MSPIEKRILEISYKNKLSHIGSCLTAAPIVEEIYKQKKSDEKFVLSSGHAGLALYCVLEAMGGRNAEEIFIHHGVHPDRCAECHIDCSTGSLGQGICIALGMALADRKKNVYCLISDGECSEGSIFEALRIMRENNIHNLQIHVNVNQWGAYKKIDGFKINGDLDRYNFFGEKHHITYHWTQVDNFPFLKDQAGHYHILTKEEYESIK